MILLRNNTTVCFLISALCGYGQALVKKEGPTLLSDPYRLDYKVVAENMHYNQLLRPQVHYTPITGQIADPTGLIKYKGKYHLFYMFDEWSKKRGDNKNWGHAISDDCIYWEQQVPVTNTIIDNRPGSGSSIVDWNNSLGLQTGIEKTMVAFYTDYGRGVCIAYSKDGGRTWIRLKKNPVLPAKEHFRDPNVFWFKPDQSWRMIVYEFPGFSFYKSSNLIDWQFLSRLDDFFECPDFFQLPIDGNVQNKKWVLIDGNGSYYIGKFDGVRFTPEGERHILGKLSVLNKSAGRTNYYTKDIYATQTWKQSYEGDGPLYQLAFMMINEPPDHNRTWSQQMIFPVELSLKTINGETVLCRMPIDGIKQLRHDPYIGNNVTLKSGQIYPENLKGDVLEIIAEIHVGDAKEIVFDIRGEKVRYNSSLKEISIMDANEKIAAVNNSIKLRFIIDRNSIEIYANEGELTITRLFYPNENNKSVSLSAIGGTCRVSNIEIYRLESIWLKREQELGYQR